MKKQNKILLATILVVMTMMLVVPMISAAGLSVILTAPANYTNATGSFSYSCTATGTGITNVTVYANSSAGVMNALQSFANISTPSQTKWNGTVTITSADDGSNQNISCYVRNATAAAYSAEKGAWHVRLDSTAPTCSISVAHTNIAYKTLQTVTWAGADATALRLTTADVNGPGDQTTLTSTANSRTLEMGTNETKYTGSWTANMTVTDWSGNSCTDSKTFKSYMPNGEEEVIAPTTQNTGKTILLLIIVAVILYIVFKKK